MKKNIYFIVFFLKFGFSQEIKPNYYIDAQLFSGNIYRHSEDVKHLITGHPTGLLVSLNKKTFGEKEWEQTYNYPDYGLSVHGVDFKNESLGKNIAIGLHYNFYFLKRNLLFRISQGIGIATNPYDRETNNKNVAFGSKILDNNYFLLQYQKQNLYKNIGFQAGLLLTHFSNGRFKAPNSGINTVVFSAGLNYNFEKDQQYVKSNSDLSFTENIKYNFAFRTGISEGPVTGLGQRSFYHLGFYADKRINRKSALQLGTDLFFSGYLKDYIQFSSVAFPDKKPIDPNVDYKRVGVYVGHELFINKLSVEAQLGYYVYKPFKYEISIYERLGLKYYFYNNLFTGVGIKAHGARAEAIEFSLGIRI
jgi:hypothetical protein